jgi:ABC-type transport system involved in cytochrome bd biosynthesis fused ATPase/permease subunit
MEKLFTKEEWKEMEQMQERAKAKQQQERARQEKKKRAKKIDRFIGAMMLLFIGGMCALMFSSILVELVK